MPQFRTELEDSVGYAVNLLEKNSRKLDKKVLHRVYRLSQRLTGMVSKEVKRRGMVNEYNYKSDEGRVVGFVKPFMEVYNTRNGKHHIMDSGCKVGETLRLKTLNRISERRMTRNAVDNSLNKFCIRCRRHAVGKLSVQINSRFVN